jgi:hypothetical protein
MSDLDSYYYNCEYNHYRPIRRWAERIDSDKTIWESITCHDWTQKNGGDLIGLGTHGHIQFQFSVHAEPPIAEYCLGHISYPNKYNNETSDVAWDLNEYRKASGNMNIISDVPFSVST